MVGEPEPPAAVSLQSCAEPSTAKTPPANLFHRKPARSELRLDFVRRMPCVICGGAHGPSEAAHTKALDPGGKGQKPSDFGTIPLCHWDHQEAPDSYHKLTPESRWAQHHGIDLRAMVDGINRLYERRRYAKVTGPAERYEDVPF